LIFSIALETSLFKCLKVLPAIFTFTLEDKNGKILYAIFRSHGKSKKVLDQSNFRCFCIYLEITLFKWG